MLVKSMVVVGVMAVAANLSGVSASMFYPVDPEEALAVKMLNAEVVPEFRAECKGVVYESLSVKRWGKKSFCAEI